MRIYIGLLIILMLLSLVSPIQSVTYAKELIIKDELKFEFWSLPWFPQSDKAAELIVKQLEKIGIKLELRRLESSIMYPRIQKFDFEAYALATSQSPNPLSMLDSFTSKWAKPDIGAFWGPLEDPEFDELINKIRTTTDPNELKRLVREAQRRIAFESGFIPIYLTQSVKVIRAEWKNYTVMTGGLLEVFDIWSILYMYKSDKPEENVFKIAFPSDVLSLNPFTAVDLRSIWIINLIYDPLVRVDPEFNVVPWLAESWEVSDDGKIYTFKLRKNVKWHDGTPFTADDVVFTFTEGIRQETQRFVGLKDIIESVEKVDDYTVRFVLKNPYPFFLIDLATGYYYIAPKHIAGELDLTQWDNKNPIGTGPFRFVERTVGEFIVLQKNDDFWMVGVPKITRIIMKVIPEAESRFLAIKKGEVDTERYDTAITLVKQAEEDPNLNVVTAPGLWLIYIAFNTVNHFYDPKVFQAIHYAIDRQEIVEKANGGFGYPVYTVLNRFWNGDLAAEDIVFEYDPDKAAKLLEEAGWVDVDGDGVREYVGGEKKREEEKPVETVVKTETVMVTETPEAATKTVTVVETVVKTVREVETKVETVTQAAGVSGGVVTGLIVVIVVLLGIIVFMASRMRRTASS